MKKTNKKKRKCDPTYRSITVCPTVSDVAGSLKMTFYFAKTFAKTAGLQTTFSSTIKIGILTENEAQVKRLFSSVSRIALRGLNLRNK